MRLNIPTINDGMYANDDIQAYKPLFDLWGKAMDSPHLLPITFDFSSCRFLRQNGVAFIGGLARLMRKRGAKVSFAWDTMKLEVLRNLEHNGFCAAFRGTPTTWNGTSVPYREDMNLDRSGLVNYLSNEWLGQKPLYLSNLLRNIIVGNVLEIYDNAFTHSQTPIGVFSCGQYYPKLKQIGLTVVDFGVGVPFNVRKYLGKLELPTSEALQWAFQSGNTTIRTMGRGLGLDLLKEFVSENGGKLQVFSQTGHAVIDASGERYHDLGFGFDGTLINITLKGDERAYRLASEDNHPGHIS